MVDLRSAKGLRQRGYVVPALLPQVLEHLPPGTRADGAVSEGGLTLPLVYEPIVCGGDGTSPAFRSVKPFYVAYGEGEAAFYLTPARFRTLVRLHRAWVVGSPTDAVRPSPPRRVGHRGGYKLAPEVAAARA